MIVLNSLLFIGMATLIVEVSSRNHAATYTPTCFVPPAAPTAARIDPVSSWFTKPPEPAPIRRGGSALSVKKKSVSPVATKKIQVKLLKHVPGTGQAGQVIMVTPAFFQNKLRPSKSAEIITDEQLQKEQAAAAAAERKLREEAEAMKEKMSLLSVNIVRKAGPDGHLFGGVGPKVVIEELKKLVGEADILNGKTVKVSHFTDVEGNEIQGDIKHVGKFEASVALTKDVSAKISIVIDRE